MNKVEVFYIKSKNELTLVSRSDQGILKSLNHKKVFVQVTKKDIKDYALVTSFLVKSKKEKITLEDNLVNEIKLLTPETLDFIKSQVLKEFKYGKPLSVIITEEFKRCVHEDMCDNVTKFMGSGESVKLFKTPFNDVELKQN